MNPLHETTNNRCDVELITAAGRSAVATVSVRGPAAVEAVEGLFRPLGHRKLGNLSNVPLRKICYGHWGPHSGQVAGKVTGKSEGEGVVVARMETDRIEVHCHGGKAAAEQIINDLIAAGCMKSPSTTTSLHRSRRSLDQQCLIQQEATDALHEVATEKAALILLDQLNGALREECERITKLLDSSALSEAAIALQQLNSTWQTGQRLIKPWQVVLGGPPNVGKSSLINALLGFHRAVVFNQPGTTRDVVTARTAIDGWLVELSDTAGLRETEDNIEQQGVKRAYNQLLTADCVVLVFDVTGDLADWSKSSLLTSVINDLPAAPIVALNKIDLRNVEVKVDDITAIKDQLTERMVNLADGEPIQTSATTGAGIDQLLNLLSERLPSKLPPGSPVLFTTRQQTLIESALSALQKNELTEAQKQLAQLTSLAAE